jgi:hypothetical protein
MDFRASSQIRVSMRSYVSKVSTASVLLGVLIYVLNSSPTEVHWIVLSGHSYRQVSASGEANQSGDEVARIALDFDSKFQGHGNKELWRINGKSYPNTDEPISKRGNAIGSY